MIPEEIKTAIIQQLNGKRKITFLVGAGLSAESGIPTFRDKDGYWTSGSKNYMPQEIGTKKMFDVNSSEVWRWYLYRNSICRKANPNIGHISLSKIEKMIPEKFSLISQNVDGLHFLEESRIENLFLIHGDLRFMRCSEECTRELFNIPEGIIGKNWTKESRIPLDDLEKLVCPNCGEMTRPHVLWFDEYYDEPYYHLHKVLRIAKETGLLFIVGTSGATNLPKLIVENTANRQGVIIDINPNENDFTDKLKKMKNGHYWKSTSGIALKSLAEFIEDKIEKQKSIGIRYQT
ncbi:MAG: Sir2 family NAD-dependent protein deacetylase [Saprospiraceae bacterium]